MSAALNKNNSAVKRIMQEAKELANDPCTDYSAAPLEDDIFEWHCTLRGPAGTDFEGGLYHFRILLPAEYPFRPPSIMLLTPNGRFELNTKICISFTSYHEELWQPAWGVRTAILGLQGFFPLKGQAAVGVGSIEYPPGERKRLAVLSREWVCPHCQVPNLELLPDPSEPDTQGRTLRDSVTTSETTTHVAEHSDPAAPPLAEPSNAPSSDQSPRTALPRPVIPTPNQQTRVQTVTTVTPQSNSDSPVAAENTSGRSESPQTAVGVHSTRPVRPTVRSTAKPPLLLDGAICVLLVLLFAIICRRMV